MEFLAGLIIGLAVGSGSIAFSAVHEMRRIERRISAALAADGDQD